MRRIISVRRGTSAGDRIQEGFATLAEIRAFPTTDILDRTCALLEGVGLFAYDSTGVGVDDGFSIITPNSNIGRWFSVLGGSPPPVSSPPSIVYRPGGVALDNVHVTWASAYAALAAIVGESLLSVDDSIVTPALVSSGAMDLGNVTVVGYSDSINAALRFMDGATCSKFFKKASKMAMTVDGAKTQPVMTLTAGAHVVELESSSISTAVGATQPFFKAGSNSTLVLNLRQSTIATGATPSVRRLISGVGYETTINALDASVIETATLSDDGAGDTAVNYDGSSTVSTVHPAATTPPTFTALETADISPYTAGFPGYSSLPAAVQDASQDITNVGPVIYNPTVGYDGGPYWARATNGAHPVRGKLRRGILDPSTGFAGPGWWTVGDGNIFLTYIAGVGYQLAFSPAAGTLATLYGSPLAVAEWPWEEANANGNVVTFRGSVDGYRWKTIFSVDVSVAPLSTTTNSYSGFFVQGTDTELLIERSDVQ